MLKQGKKTINAEFIQTCIIPTFFRPVQNSCNFVPGASSLFNVNAKKQKDPGNEFGLYAFVQDLG